MAELTETNITATQATPEPTLESAPANPVQDNPLSSSDSSSKVDFRDWKAKREAMLKPESKEESNETKEETKTEATETPEAKIQREKIASRFAALAKKDKQVREREAHIAAQYNVLGSKPM